MSSNMLLFYVDIIIGVSDWVSDLSLMAFIGQQGPCIPYKMCDQINQRVIRVTSRLIKWTMSNILQLIFKTYLAKELLIIYHF